MKKIIIYLICFSLLITLISCSETKTGSYASASPVSTTVPSISNLYGGTQSLESAKTTGQNNKYSFAIVYGGPHPFFDPWRFAAQAAAKDLGIPVPNVTCPPDWDQIKQNAIINGLVTGGVSGFGIFTSDTVAGNVKITELADEGIPVVALGGSPAMPTKAKFCYETDTKTLTAAAIQAAIDELKRRGKNTGNIVLLVTGLSDTGTDPIMALVGEVFNKPENNGFVLYDLISDTYDKDTTEKAISKIYSSYIKHVDAIVSSGYANSEALAGVMKVRNKNNDIVVIGVDDSAEVLSAIGNGCMFGSVTQASWAMGYVGISALKLFADGYIWKKDAPLFIDPGLCLLTEDGLDTYQQTQQQIAYDFVATMKEKYFDSPVN